MTVNRKPSKKVSPEMAAHIRYLVREQNLYQHQVAALLEINQGRVSEVINDHYYPDEPPSQGAFPF